MDEPRFSPERALPLEGLPPLPPSPFTKNASSSSPSHNDKVPTPSSPSQPQRHSSGFRPPSAPQSPGAQPVERLAHRLSKQTLRTSGRPIPRGGEPGICSPLLASTPSTQGAENSASDPVKSQGSMAMEVDPKEDSRPPTTLSDQMPPSMRSLKRPVEEISSDIVRWDIGALERCRSREQGLSASQPAGPCLSFTDLLPPIAADRTLVADLDILEATEDYGVDSRPVCDVDPNPDDDFLSTFRIEYRTSRQAAGQCSKLVRNRPRRRKRVKRSGDELRSRSTTVSTMAGEERFVVPEQPSTKD